MNFLNTVRYLPPFFVGAVVASVVNNRYGQIRLPEAITKSKPAGIVPPIPWKEPGKYEKKPKLFATGDTIFSFNINHGLFIATRAKSSNATGARWLVSSPVSAQSIINQELSKTSVDPYLVSFTPHGDEFIVMKHNDGLTSWKLHFNPARYVHAPSYESLTRWIKENIFATDDSHKNFNVVFGPGSSYFARTKTECCWQDLPTRLEDIIHEKKKAYAENEDPESNKHGWIPRIVALGAQETWVAVWADGRAAWSLKANHQLVKDALGPDEIHVPVDSLENLVLNPHNTLDYASVTKFGHFDWLWSTHDPNSTTTMDLMCHVIEYQQMRSKEDGLSFVLNRRHKGPLESITISPDSDWTEERLMAISTPFWAYYWNRAVSYVSGR